MRFIADGMTTGKDILSFNLQNFCENMVVVCYDKKNITTIFMELSIYG